ncbi:patatin [Adhaeribacter rhizoryzae]|uniref:Patatin n=1 Tax=Adhaeribacter rhizoryzae TaxID=2607907 RepID=A0A5M6D123_9BACT|nr:patatin [Adhaeribacter rhizoryzae]KAA5541197.1 patatin [Adhaeribacter rhizoryzae]
MPRLLPKLLLFISGVTVLTGAVQVVAAPLVLNIVGARTDKTSAHFFAIVGMFMVLFGGLLWQSLKRPLGPEPIFWCGLQKFGAAVAIGLGVRNGIFSSLALSVALFDFVSGILIFTYWRNFKNKA